jgi:type II secretory pathway pseudopilin PulG
MEDETMKRKSFFTIVELLIVIAIIGIIMAILLPALSKARAVGKRTACLSQLRQIGTAMQLYKTDSNLNPVPWTSMLFPEYVSSNKVYQCPSDLNPPTTAANAWLERIDNDWNEVYDRPSPGGGKSVGVNNYVHITSPPEKDAGNVSYFYEMSDMACSWNFTYTPSGTPVPSSVSGLPTNPTWAEWKEIQLNHGGDETNSWGTPYSVSAFPIYRCFWHMKHVKNYASGIPNPAEPVINITYGGNYVITKMHWEEGVWSP